MAKRVRDSILETRAARSKLKPSGKPYYRAIGEGLHLGYRKGQTEGKWVVRRYAGAQTYITDTIATADDTADADGARVLSFWQAQDKAREIGGAMVYSGPYRVRDAMSDYLAFLGDRGKVIKLRIDKHVLPALGDDLVGQLTSERIRAWHNGMVRAGDAEAVRKSKVSANRMLATLKSALNLAFREEKAASDAAWKRVSLFKNVVRARTRYLSLAECERLLNASAPDFRALVRGALETGARYGELCRMVCSDFNPDAGTVHVQRSKSGRERHIILTAEGADFFREITAGRAKDSLIFARASGEAWLADHQKRRMIDTCDAATIAPRINFHGLRHTWASHAVMAGMPLMIVARNLGHTSTKMVEKHYGHLCPDFVADQVRKYAPRFGSTGTSNVRAIR